MKLLKRNPLLWMLGLSLAFGVFQGGLESYVSLGALVILVGMVINLERQEP